MNSVKFSFFVILFLAIGVGEVCSEVRLDFDSLPVVKRQKVPGPSFWKSGEVISQLMAEQGVTGVEAPKWDARLYKLSSSEEETVEVQPEDVKLPQIPACSGAAMRRHEVYQNTPQSELFDVIFMNPDSTEQVRASQRAQARVIPYRSGQSEEMAETNDPWSLLAVQFEIRCLPTRFRFSSEGGKRYIEYREGSSAWE